MNIQNNLNKSDRKFVRLEKGRIRARVLDVKKQEELITALYKKFIVVSKVKGEKEMVEVKAETPKKEVKKMEVKKEAKPKKVASKK